MSQKWQVVDGKYQTWVNDEYDYDTGVSTPGYWKDSRQATSADMNYAEYGIDPNAKDKANQLTAAITRKQYDDYRTRFLPYTEQLRGQISPESVAQQKAQWGGQIAQQAANAPIQALGMASRNQSRYGASMDGRSQGYGMRMNELNAASNQVSQTNQTNQALDDRAAVLLSGSRLRGDA